MTKEWSRKLTRVVALRLALLCLPSAAVAYLSFRYLSTNAVGVYLTVLSGVVAALIGIPLVVIAVAAVARQPIERLPRWFVVVGALASLGGLISYALVRAAALLVLCAAGFWLLLIGAGAAVTVGLWRAWS